MLTPEELKEIADTTTPIWNKLCIWINNDIIRRLCARINRKEQFTFTSTDKWQSKVLQDAGGHLADLQSEIVKITNQSDKEVKRVFEEAGITSLERDDKMFKKNGNNPQPIPKSPRMKEILNDAYKRTSGDIHNMTRTTMNISQNRLIDVLDKTYIKVASGAQSSSAAIREAINEVAGTNPYVIYRNKGKREVRMSIESVVAMCIRTGIGQAAGNMSIQRMKEMDWDIVLTSAHLGARCEGTGPMNHEEWQGQFFSLSGNDKKYKPFYSTTGYGTIEGLCGINCRHSFGPGDGKHNPYKNFNKEENEKVYELSQKQRAMERSIRNLKRELIGIKTGIDNIDDVRLKFDLQQDYDKLALRLKKKQSEYDAFCKENGLNKDYERIEMAKWDREQAKSARISANQQGKIKNNDNKTYTDNSSNVTIRPTENTKEVSEVHSVGKIDREIYKCISDDIKTDEVIITDERIQHIKDRHPNDFERYYGYMKEIVETPDYIVETNKPKTALILKAFNNGDEPFKTVLRLVTSEDNPNFKNSIITFMKIDEKEWSRLIRNKKNLYKRE